MGANPGPPYMECVGLRQERSFEPHWPLTAWNWNTFWSVRLDEERISP